MAMEKNLLIKEGKLDRLSTIHDDEFSRKRIEKHQRRQFNELGTMNDHWAATIQLIKNERAGYNEMMSS